jgi:hypothetical protein
MEKYLGKIRPQVMAAVLALLALGLYGLRIDAIEVTTGSGAGIIALAKDVLASDNN